MRNYINYQSIMIWKKILSIVGPFGGEIHSPSGTIVVNNTLWGDVLASHLGLRREGTEKACFSILSYMDEDFVCAAEVVTSCEHIIDDIREITCVDNSCLRSPPRPDSSVCCSSATVLPLKTRLEVFLQFIDNQDFLNSSNIIRYFEPS